MMGTAFIEAAPRKKLAREADSIQNTPRPLVIKQRSVIVDKDVDHVNSNS